MPEKAMLYSGLCFLFFALSCHPSPVSDPSLNPYTGAQSPQEYLDLKADIASEKARMQREFTANPTAEQLDSTRRYLRRRLETDLIPSWYGTTWDFNGITQVPREGEIACGYFVSTLLRDLGFKLERYKLAQQASLYIVHSLSPAGHRLDFSGISTTELEQKMSAEKKGFYVVGLDNHVGFLLVDKAGKLWFLHSSYGDPAVVVREKATESQVLSWSNRYVIGYLESDWIVRKWLSGEKIETKKPG